MVTAAAILDFWVLSVGLSVQEKKFKTHFQDGGHLGFPIGMILVIFDLQAAPVLPIKFRVE